MMLTSRQFPAVLFAFTVLILVPRVGPAQDPPRPSSPNQQARPQEDAKTSQQTPAPEPTAAATPTRRTARFPRDFRSVDGLGNNPDHPEWGGANIPFLRLTTVGYEDGVTAPSGGPSARSVSNACAAQGESVLSSGRASDFVWQWGQFLDHDIDLTPVVEPEEAFDIAVPAGDLWFDPTATGQATIPLDRSLYRTVDGVRQQINEITAFIDASNVYGSDPERAQELRALDGSGRLKTSAGDLLPFNDAGLPNAQMGDAPAFLAGDFRANEQVALTSMHTLFMREHNYWADRIAEQSPNLSGDEIYQRARAMVGAEMQAITYREFLPVLLGEGALAPYRGYRAQVNPGISNVFATAAYRMGHSMLSSQLLRLDENGEELVAGHLDLANAFFSPNEVLDHGIEPLLRGLAAQRAQRIDNMVVDDVRNFLFGPPGSGGFDLASLNIQRGRDHGLPGYNQMRIDFGLRAKRSFAAINRDPGVRADLAAVYDSVDEIDAWVGGLAEPPVNGALVGETWRAILVDQFERLRDGDRFWYEAYLPRDMVRTIERQTLATIIRRNTEISSELQDNPFRVPRTGEPSN